MDNEIELSDAQVFVECSSLPPLLRNDLQAFLEGQPGVRQVTRKLHLSEAILSPNTVGLVSPSFDLVVHLAEGAQLRTAESNGNRAALILGKVAEWTQRNRPRSAGE
jgi:hypothetical protein